MAGLIEAQYLKFPFTVDMNGSKTSDRSAHVREQIEQVLFTSPKERVFRPDFGVGVRRLVFEPNNTVLRNSILKQLNTSLTEALYGEVDARTLKINVTSEDEKLIISISYILAAINSQESHIIKINASGSSDG